TTWVEHDSGIAGNGIIGLQIHGESKGEVSFRNVSLEELPNPGVPTEAEVLSRFGDGQPSLPLESFVRGKFQLGKNEMIAFVGQENLVREQEAGELESQLAYDFSAKN